MSLGVYPVFRPDVSEAKPRTLGHALAREVEALDRVADAHKLPRFTDFADNRPIPEGFSGPPEELEELLGPCNAWFDPAEGERAFQGLINAIANDPTAANEVENPGAAIKELKELIRVLRTAQDRGATFRLEIG